MWRLEPKKKERKLLRRPKLRVWVQFQIKRFGGLHVRYISTYVHYIAYIAILRYASELLFASKVHQIAIGLHKLAFNTAAAGVLVHKLPV